MRIACLSLDCRQACTCSWGVARELLMMCSSKHPKLTGMPHNRDTHVLARTLVAVAGVTRLTTTR